MCEIYKLKNKNKNKKQPIYLSFQHPSSICVRAETKDQRYECPFTGKAHEYSIQHYTQLNIQHQREHCSVIHWEHDVVLLSI